MKTRILVTSLTLAMLLSAAMAIPSVAQANNRYHENDDDRSGYSHNNRHYNRHYYSRYERYRYYRHNNYHRRHHYGHHYYRPYYYKPHHYQPHHGGYYRNNSHVLFGVDTGSARVVVRY